MWPFSLEQRLKGREYDGVLWKQQGHGEDLREQFNTVSQNEETKGHYQVVKWEVLKQQNKFPFTMCILMWGTFCCKTVFIEIPTDIQKSQGRKVLLDAAL